MKTERKTRVVKVTPRIHGYVVVTKATDGSWTAHRFKSKGEVRPPRWVYENIVGHGPHHVKLQVVEAFRAWGIREGWIAPLH